MTRNFTSDNSGKLLGTSTNFHERYLTRCANWTEVQPLITARVPVEALPILDDAWIFAIDRHSKQQRPDGRPFATHLAETVEILLAGSDCITTAALVVALLHDIVEDTNVTIDDIRRRYGSEIADAVAWLTIPPVDSGEQREIVRAAAFARLHRAPRSVQQIKLADRISTVQRIDNHPVVAKQVQRYRETVTYMLPLAGPFTLVCRSIHAMAQRLSLS